MKRIVLFVVACATGLWGYRKLRSHPATAPKLAELEQHTQEMAEKASTAAHSAKSQAVSKAATIAGSAATGAQAAITTASDKAQEAIGAAADKAGAVFNPIHDKIGELRGGTPEGAHTEPGLERPSG